MRYSNWFRDVLTVSLILASFATGLDSAPATVERALLTPPTELSATDDPGGPVTLRIEAVAAETTEPTPLAGVAPGRFRVTRSGGTNETATVFVEYSGTATIGGDYTDPGQFLHLVPGQTSLEIFIRALDDNFVEGDEVVIATLSDPPIDSLPNYVIDSARNTASVTIHDNKTPPGPPVIWIETIEPATSEPYSSGMVVSGKVRVFRSGPTTGHLLVFLEYGGTATGGADYRELPRWYVSIPAGAFSADLEIVALADRLVEGKETAVVRVLPEVPPDFTLDIAVQEYRVSLGRDVAQVIIFDRQTRLTLPTIGIEATEPIAGECPPNADCLLGAGRFTIYRTGELDFPLPVYLTFGGAAQASVDYRFFLGPEARIDPATGTLMRRIEIPSKASEFHIVIDPIDDALHEGDETIVARIEQLDIDTSQVFPPLDYHLDPARASATVVIRDNDSSDGPTVSISGLSSTPEFCPPNAFCAPINFTLRRTGSGLDRPLNVFLRYRGTASAGDDYPVLPHAVTFEAGRDVASLFAVAIDDLLDEGDETVIAVVGAGWGTYNVDPSHAEATVAILDNDDNVRPLVSLEPVDRESMETHPFQNNIDWGEFRVTRTGDTNIELPVYLRQPEGTARFGVDYRLIGQYRSQPEVGPGAPIRILRGLRSVNVRLYPIDDEIYEGGETAVMTLSEPPAGTPESAPYQIDPTRSSATFVIHDNDLPEASIDITSPHDGEQFRPGDSIEIHAVAVDPDGYISHIEFFDDERRIGESRISFFLPPDPGTPIKHRFVWNGAGGGPHSITARSISSFTGLPRVVSHPVRITVGPGPAWPVVSLATPHEVEKTGEPCPACLVLPGEVIVSRTGPTTEPLRVYLEADGTARADLDYQRLPAFVTIPAGTNATRATVLALDDLLAEGPEVVRVRIDRPPELATLGYLYNVYASQAFVIIGDDERGAPEARLEFLEPQEGGQYAAGTPIALEALGIFTRGEINRVVEFYSDGVLIGRSSPLVTTRPTIPCLPNIHTFVWTNPPPGRLTLTARSEISLNQFVQASPIHIVVGDPTPQPMVRIESTQRISEETSDPLRRVPFRGEFTISRRGRTQDALPVFVLFSGTASNGVDYPAQPFLVSIPAGENSTRIEIVPNLDNADEGIETVVATLSYCPPVTNPPLGIPCYLGFEIDPAHESATVFIRDDGITQASLHLTQPPDRAEFNWGQTITLEANAIDLDDFIRYVAFYDGDQRIGESEIAFIRTPDPGTLITHTFDWASASPGSHVLTARAFRPDGAAVISQRVTIIVGPRVPEPVLQFAQPQRNDVYSTRDEIPLVLHAFASNDVFLGAEIFANGVKIADSSFCCWLCPCARPPVGQETVLQIPVRPDSGPAERPWQGWISGYPGLYQLTARAIGEHGTTMQAGPVRIFVFDPTLRMSAASDGTMRFVIPEGSLAPGRYDLEASSDLRTWTRLGPFEPGNVAAFYFDRPPLPPRRFYRSVFYPTPFP